MSIKYLQNLVVSMVIVPAPDCVIFKRGDIQLPGPGHSLGLTANSLQCLQAIDEVAQTIPPVTLWPSPRREVFYLAENLLLTCLGQDFRILEKMKGSDLEGMAYEGIFDHLEFVERSGARGHHAVIPWD